MKKKGITFDYLITFFSEFLVLATGILVYKFASSELGDTGFSSYAVTRRTISFLQPLLILGLGVGLPRYVAFSKSGNTELGPGSYLTAASLLLVSVSLIFILSALAFSGYYAKWIFGDVMYSNHIFPLALCICGLVFHALVYSYNRGLIRMVRANIFQMINLGLVPLAAFATHGDTVEVLKLTGSGWIGVSILFFLFHLKELNGPANSIWKAGKDLLNYGLRRVPGDLMIMGLLSLPAFFAAHVYKDNLSTAGDIAFSMSLLNMAGAAFGPVCLILLPQASRIIAEKDFEKLRSIFWSLTKVTAALCVLGLLLALPFMHTWLSFYLESSSPQLEFISSLTLLGAIGYCMYISLRSIIDAFYIRAINSRNIFFAFVFFIFTSGFAWYYNSSITVFLLLFICTMTLLGTLTFIQVYGLVNSGIRDSLNSSAK